jgi:hypothetical protein
MKNTIFDKLDLNSNAWGLDTLIGLHNEFKDTYVTGNKLTVFNRNGTNFDILDFYTGFLEYASRHKTDADVSEIKKIRPVINEIVDYLGNVPIEKYDNRLRKIVDFYQNSFFGIFPTLDHLFDPIKKNIARANNLLTGEKRQKRQPSYFSLRKPAYRQ